MPKLVKICGITDPVAMQAAASAGADFAGLVFFAKSPRNLDIAQARALRDLLPLDGTCKAVALVVDADDAALAAIVSGVAPDYLQLHGHESPARVEAVRAKFGLPVIKAVPVATAAEVEAAMAYLDPGRRADIILFDAKPDPKGVRPGGNGLAFDWHILDGIKGRSPFALAGGLTPDNVAAAIAMTGATIVDVSSGVESAPGVKDPGLIRRFLQAAKEAKQEAESPVLGS